MLSIKFIFNDILQGANAGKIRVQVIKEVTGTDFNRTLYFKVVDPTGQVVRDYPAVALPDLTVSGTDASDQIVNIVDIPVDSENRTLEGEYIITAQIVNNDDTALVEFAELKHDYCPSVVSPDLQTVISCDKKTLTIDDKTDYSNYTISSRTIKVVPPSIMTSTMKTKSTISSNMVYYFDYDNISLNVSLYSLITRLIESTITSTFQGNTTTSIDDVSVEEKLERDTNTTVSIACQVSSCADISGALDELRNLEEESCAYGGISSLPKNKLDRYHYLNSLLLSYGLTRNCNAGDDVSALVVEINKIVPSTSKTTTDPIPFTEDGTSSKETPWTNITDNAELASADVELYNNNVDTHPLRYRITSTGHLEIMGTIKINSGASIVEVLKDFFSEQYAPTDEEIVNLKRTNTVPLMPLSPNLVTSFYMNAYLADGNNDGKWGLYFQGKRPATPYYVIIHGLFVL